MGEYMGDLSALYATQATVKPQTSNSKAKGNSLDMTDFLSLMVAQFQNQSMDNTADTSDMLNQLVMMQTVQALSNITDATIMSYAGSLVGKEVTVGQFNSQGRLEELVGTVTGTGISGGTQVIFVNGKSYSLSSIMAIGRLPNEGSVQPLDPVEENEPEDEVGEIDPENIIEELEPENGTEQVDPENVIETEQTEPTQQP